MFWLDSQGPLGRTLPVELPWPTQPVSSSWLHTTSWRIKLDYRSQGHAEGPPWLHDTKHQHPPTHTHTAAETIKCSEGNLASILKVDTPPPVRVLKP